MARFTLSRVAERHIVSILAWTHEHSGEQVRLRCEAWLVQAIADVAEDPQRAGSASRDEISRVARTYPSGTAVITSRRLSVEFAARVTS